MDQADHAEAGGLEPRVVQALLERERIIMAARLLPGVVHNLSGAVQAMSLPLDLAFLALQKSDASKLNGRMENLREGLERLTGEVALLARRSQSDCKEAAEPLNLKALAEHELAFWRGDLFVKHDLALERDLPSDLGLARAAPADAALAFNLLMANAVEAVREGPSPVIKVSALAVEGGLALEISDSGPGPSPRMHERMFQPFVGDRGPEHQGLGLFLAVKALEPWGGAVSWLPGASRNTFRITLPKN